MQQLDSQPLGSAASPVPESPQPPVSKRRPRKRWLVLGISIGLVVALGAGYLLKRHDSKLQKSAITQAVSKLATELYADTMKAEQLSNIEDEITFWKIEQQEYFGPKALICTGSDTNPWSTTTLLFKDRTTTALAETSSLSGLYQSYSGDSDVQAFDIRDYVGEDSVLIRSMGASLDLTDKDGNVLQDGAVVTPGPDGSYNLYGKSVQSKDDPKYDANCDTLMVHMTINAGTAQLSKVAIYKDSVSDDNLSFGITQDIEMRSGDFASLEGAFSELGFSREAADLAAKGQDYAQLDNTQAGYNFRYLKSYLGTPKVTEIKNDAGQIITYSYEFSGAPGIKYEVYTKYNTTAYPLTHQQMLDEVSKNGWTLKHSYLDSGPNLPGYGKVSAGSVMAVGGGKQRFLVITGSTDIPAAYGEVRDTYYPVDNPTQAGTVAPFWNLAYLDVFKPGTQPSRGL